MGVIACSGGGDPPTAETDGGREETAQAGADTGPANDEGGSAGWRPQRDDDGCWIVPPPTVPTAFELGHDEGAFYLTWKEPAGDYQAYEEAVSGGYGTLLEQCGPKLRHRTTRYDIYFGVEADPPLVAGDVALREKYCNYLTRETDGLCWFLFDDEEGTPVQRGMYWLKITAEKYRAYSVRLRVRNSSGESVSEVNTVSWGGPDQRCPGQPAAVDRDGNSYETVQVGTQCWLSGDLRVGNCVHGRQLDNGTVEKNCDPCASGCPGYYTWRELMNYDALSSLCPTGWHLPSFDEWKLLVNHSDFARFEPRYGGYKDSSNRKAGGPKGYYWTASRGNRANVAQAIVFPWPTLNEPIDLATFDDNSFQLAARCVK